MKFIDLNATKRIRTGKGAAYRLRQSEYIPAILYGHMIDPEPLSLSFVELNGIFRKHGQGRLFFNLIIEGNNDDVRTTLLKETQINNITGKIYHIDLQQIDINKKIRTTVPLVTKGLSKGVEEGGLLQLVRRKLEIICLPKDIPDSIEIDVTDLGIGNAIHVSELALPENISAPHDVDFTIVTVLQSKGMSLETEVKEEADAETPAVKDSKDAKDSKDSKKAKSKG